MPASTANLTARSVASAVSPTVLSARVGMATPIAEVPGRNGSGLRWQQRRRQRGAASAEPRAAVERQAARLRKLGARYAGQSDGCEAAEMHHCHC